MFDTLRPVKECYEFIINFKGKDTHIFVIHTMDEENFHSSDTEIYYLDDSKEKQFFKADEEIILREFLVSNGYEKI